MATKQNSPFGGYTWFAPPTTEFALLNVTECKRPHDWHTFRISNPDWVLNVFHNGGALVRMNSERNDWVRREAFVAHLYPPGFTYWEDIRPLNEPLFSSWINFRVGPGLGLDRYVANAKGYAEFLDPEHKLKELLHQMHLTAISQGDDAYWELMPSFFSAIALLKRAVPISPGSYRIIGDAAVHHSHPVVIEVQGFLRDHVSEPVRLASVARKARMSVSALIRRYKAETGETPMKTLQRMRVNMAKTHLVRGGTLETVAKRLGFCDAYHLSKTFKRIEGIPPRKFLAAVRQAQQATPPDLTP